MVTSQAIGSRMKTLESTIITPAEVLVRYLLNCAMGTNRNSMAPKKNGYMRKILRNTKRT